MGLCLGKRVLQGVSAAVLAVVVATTPAFANSVVYVYNHCSPGAFATVADNGTTTNGGTASFGWYECAGTRCGTTTTYSSEPSGDQVYSSNLTASPTAVIENVTISLSNGTLGNSPSGSCA